MKKLWDRKKLGEILTLEYGKPLSPDNRKVDGKYPVYGANGIKDRTDSFYFDQPSIIIGRKGSAGEITLTDEKFWPLDVTYYTVFDQKKYDLKFLFYLLKNLQLQKLAKGVKPGINRNDVYAIEAGFPPLPEQQRIVDILDQSFAAIDQAIENTEKNINNINMLEENYLSELFISPLFDWKEATLGEICEKINDGTHSTPTYLPTGIPFLSVKNLTNGIIDFSNTRFISEEEHKILTKRCKPEKGDILYTKVGTTGIAKVVDTDKEFSIFVSVALLKIKKDIIDNYYLENFLNSPIARKQAKERTRGTANKNLVIQDMKQIVIYYPELLTDQKKIINLIENFSTNFKKIKSNYSVKLEKLQELKLSLLHKAFNGVL